MDQNGWGNLMEEGRNGMEWKGHGTEGEHLKEWTAKLAMAGGEDRAVAGNYAVAIRGRFSIIETAKQPKAQTTRQIIPADEQPAEGDEVHQAVAEEPGWKRYGFAKQNRFDGRFCGIKCLRQNPSGSREAHEMTLVNPIT